MKYPLASTTWDNKEKQALLDIIETGHFTMGKKVKEFETQFANFFGSRYAVMVNSGSSANLIATAALFFKKNNPLKEGDEVIVPAVSWSTSYYPLQQYGLKCKFVDIDKETLNYNLSELKNAISNKTKLILCVNILGNPIDYNTIQKIIGNKDIILLEDNCESMGAKFENKFTGTFGLLGTFSTFFSHHISTMEGGVVTTDNEELYHIMLSLRSHGWTRHLPQENLITGKKSENPFEESFKFVLPGYNLRPGEMHAAVGIEQLKKLPHLLDIRKQNAVVFNKAFKNHPFISIQKAFTDSSWFGFALIVKKDAPYTRDQLVDYLSKSGIDCRPIVSGNFLKNDVLKFFNYEIYNHIENAQYLDQNGFFIGNHHYKLDNEISELIKLISDLK